MEKESRFISLVSDTTFKYMFKNKDTRILLEEIILDKTGIDLSNYNLISEEDNTGNNIKDYRMDLVFEHDKNIVIIEMNSQYNKITEIKSMKYLYRVAGRLLDSGEKYLSNKKVKLIMFNNYYCKDNKCIDISHSYFSDHKNNIIHDDIEMYRIYLPIFKEICYDKCSKVDKRLQLFTCTSYEEMDRIIDNKEDKKILEILRRLVMDNAFLFDYDHEKVKKMTEESLREEGYEDGIKQEKIDIAKSMLNDGVDITSIVKYTNLSENEINELKNTTSY